MKHGKYLLILVFLFAPLFIHAQSSTLTDGLVGHWKFDSINALVTPDASGTGNTGTVGANSRLVSGKFGQALRMDLGGSQQFMATKNSFGSPQWSISAWVNPDVPIETAAPYSGAYTFFSADQSATDKPQMFVVTRGDVRTSITKIGSYSFENNPGWHHIVITYDNTSLTTYVDGTVRGSIPFANVLASNIKRYIGTNAGPAKGQIFVGSIDETRLYNRVLSTAEISMLYNNTISSPTPTVTKIPVITTGTVRFAVIGDYGKDNAGELSVSNLVKSWNPDFIITLGDNNYPDGSASTIENTIGKYYGDYIYHDKAPYTSSATVNRFFPSLGNHDWYTAKASAYLNYFSLPGNERYYDYVIGPVHFFAVDSDPNEPDGITATSVQANWLKTKLANSKSKWKVVYFHHPPYGSGGHHGGTPSMQWPFKAWGASIVLSGHEHSYERLQVDGLTYFVNGLGGAGPYAFAATPVAGSQVRYSAELGAQLVEATDKSISFKFYNIKGVLIDTHTISANPSDADLDGVTDGNDLCPGTPPNLRSQINTAGCIKPKVTVFDIKPTFESLLRTLIDFELGKKNVAKIKYTQPVTVFRDTDQIDLDANVVISNKRVEVKSTNAPELNKPAVITFYGITEKTPRIMKDGVECKAPQCVITSNVGGVVTVTVSGF